MSIGIRNGDIVVTQSATFVATVNTIVNAEETPLFLDVESGSLELREDQLREAFKRYGSRIKAIIPVCLYGRMQNLYKILDIGEARDIPVIEDACQAHGAELNGKKVGSIGTSGAFSFYSSKNMTVGGRWGDDNHR